MGDENGCGDARSGAEMRDSGDARATDGGAAITRASAATAPGAPGSVSVEATGAAYASRVCCESAGHSHSLMAATSTVAS